MGVKDGDVKLLFEVVGSLVEGSKPCRDDSGDKRAVPGREEDAIIDRFSPLIWGVVIENCQESIFESANIDSLKIEISSDEPALFSSRIAIAGTEEITRDVFAKIYVKMSV
jgi:hypothetical protein